MPTPALWGHSLSSRLSLMPPWPIMLPYPISERLWALLYAPFAHALAHTLPPTVGTDVREPRSCVEPAHGQAGERTALSRARRRPSHRNYGVACLGGTNGSKGGTAVGKNAVTVWSLTEVKTRYNVPIGNTASTQGLAPIVCPGALWLWWCPVEAACSCSGGKPCTWHSLTMTIVRQASTTASSAHVF